MNMYEIGLKISALRKQRDMTQLELADKMGVSYQAVSSWERGATMPDISRLPEISQVLGTTIDELLGNSAQSEIVKNVLTNQTDANDPPELADIQEIAPILKPSQVDQLVEKAGPANISMEDLAGFAPFLSKDVVSKLARQAESVNDISTLSSLAPFICKDVLGELALKATDIGNIALVCDLAPFLDRAVVSQLAQKIEEVDGMAVLSCIAPFVDKDTLGLLAKKAINTGDVDGLSAIAPFVDSELFGQLVLQAAGAGVTE